ncbi:MAG: D-tyrosyl-tRNA(Tyr) deacylase [Candidatus Cloacimonetes bacterium]|nr:D-tyrosyl-tRNA(Tyr) deacylase [Candidatus Cloacimonadota bacterium]
MRLVIQRVLEASVEVENRQVARIGQGLLVLVGVGREDGVEQIDWLAKKLCELRIFEDTAGKMNLNLLDIKGEILLVSQFTLYADCSRGKRPGFEAAGKPEEANRLFNEFVKKVKVQGFQPETGIFGADMKVQLINDGPVTIFLEK